MQKALGAAPNRAAPPPQASPRLERPASQRLAPPRALQTTATQGQQSNQALKQEAVVEKWATGPTTPSNTCNGSGMGVWVNSNCDSGNIDVVRITDRFEDRPTVVELNIHPDPYCDSDKAAHSQWFHFRVTGSRGEDMTVRILNAGETSFPAGWIDYNVCASYDKRYWFRVPSTFDRQTGEFSFTHKPEKDACSYAYFAPYSMGKHKSLIADMQCVDRVRLEVLGETLDGHDLSLLRVGEDGPDKRKIWIVARQHPGESMAEWYVEGLLRRLVDGADPVSRTLLRKTVFYVVPNMNPDGTWRGHLRVNSAGANLNREWANPSMDRSPEVFLVRNRMDQTGVDFLLDVHGDECIPANFVAGNEGIPAWDDRLKKLQHTFVDAYVHASPDFQTELGYGVSRPGQANLTLCSKQVGQRFKCLALTLEQPFKDTAASPEPIQGWSPERAKAFGAAVLGPILEVVPILR